MPVSASNFVLVLAMLAPVIFPKAGTAGADIKVSRRFRSVLFDLRFGTSEAEIMDSILTPPPAGVRASILHGVTYDLAAAVHHAERVYEFWAPNGTQSGLHFVLHEFEDPSPRQFGVECRPRTRTRRPGGPIACPDTLVLAPRQLEET